MSTLSIRMLPNVFPLVYQEKPSMIENFSTAMTDREASIFNHETTKALV